MAAENLNFNSEVPNIQYKHYKFTSNKSLFIFAMANNTGLISMDFLEGEYSPRNGYSFDKLNKEELKLSQDSGWSLTGLMDMIDKDQIEYEIPVRTQPQASKSQNIVINGISAEQIDDLSDNSEVDEAPNTNDSSIKKNISCLPELNQELAKTNTESSCWNSNSSELKESIALTKWSLHNQSFSYIEVNSKKQLCSKWFSSLISKDGIVPLANIAADKINRWKETYDFASKHVRDWDSLDLSKWKSEIRKDLNIYFEYLDANISKLKNQAFKEVDQIFEHDMLNGLIKRKEFIDSLQKEISEKIAVLSQDMNSENYSSIVKKEKVFDHIEKSLLLLTLESKQYQAKLVRRESQLDSLIARIKAMVLKIDDALFSTVFSKVHEAERSKVGNLFSTLEINNNIPSKSDVTPLYWYYKEFVKDKALSPLQGWIEAISKWEKINENRKNIFINIAKKHNEDWIGKTAKKEEYYEEQKRQPFIPEQPTQKLQPVEKVEWLQKYYEDYQNPEQFEDCKVENCYLFQPQIQYSCPQDISYQHSRPNVNGIWEEDSLQKWGNSRKQARRSEFEMLKGVPTNLKVIEKRMLQKELEKRLDPIISNKIKSLQNMNNRRREEKGKAKARGEESDERKYEKSQLTRIHRIMKTIY